jgi:hypothetical protein
MRQRILSLVFVCATLATSQYLTLPARADTTPTLTAIGFALADTNNCPATGCVIKLACGSGSDSSAVGSSDLYRVSFATKKNVRIAGCGIDATTVEWDVSAGSGTANYAMFNIDTSTDGGSITFQDMTLILKVTCSGVCPSKGAAARIRGKVSNVKFERVHFQSYVTGGGFNTGAESFPAAVYVLSDGTNRPKAISVLSSKFESSGTGVTFSDCDDCWVNGSYFEDAPSGALQAYAYLLASQGESIRVVNNSFDMESAGYNTDGIRLDKLSNSSPGAGAQVLSNSFYNMQVSNNGQAVVVNGYNDAVINGNRFHCNAGIIGCFGAIATSGSCTGCNRRTVITNNVFDRYYDNGSSTCPIYFGGGDAQQVVVGNMFSVYQDGTAAGACGSLSTATRADNKIVTTP